MITVTLFLAGLMGAAGVMLAALGAHGRPGLGLASAAHMLLFHAIAVLGATALLDSGRLWRTAGQLAQAGWILGAVLFAGDIALRVFGGQRLFPMAAPAGGTILIAAWITLALAAVGGRRP